MLTKTSNQKEAVVQEKPHIVLLTAVPDLFSLLQITLDLAANWPILLADSIPDLKLLAEQQGLDLILLDLDAIHSDIIKQIQAEPSLIRIPIVGLVPRDRLFDQVFAKELRLTAIVAKPFDPAKLIDTIASLIAQKERHGEKN